MSQKGHYKQFSRDGFQPLTHRSSREMANPNDVTIDIPMTRVTSATSPTGARKPDGLSTVPSHPHTDLPDDMNEKQEHIFHPGGRRRRLERRDVESKDQEEAKLTPAGRLYRKIYNASVLVRYFIYVAPLALAIAAPIVVGATVAPRAKIGGVRIVWFFSWIEVVWCSLWLSKLLARFLPHLFQFLCGVVSSGTRKYALILKALEIPLSLVGWALVSLTTFVPIMCLNPDQRALGQTHVTSWENTVKNILFAALFSTLLFLAEKTLIQLLSMSYHRKQFDDRIKESKHNVHLVSLLYDASRHLFPVYCQEFAEDDYLINDVLDLGALASKRNSLRPGHKRSGSATPMKLMRNVARVGDKVTSAFGNVAQEITGKKVFNPTSAHSIVVQALEKKRSAEALARRLWMSFVLEGREALTLDDLMDVLGSEREQEAHEAFEILDVDGNGDISLDEMILRLTEFGRERKAIANSLHDVDQAINVLDNLLCTVVFVGVIFIFVAWLNKNFTTTLATAGTALLSLSFVFSVSAQEVLGSCIFLFVKHPFDVGDRVDVGDTQYNVERMSLLYTVFRRVKDQKRTQVPNIVLNSNWIDNVSRSKAMREQLTIDVSFDTSFEDIELLKKEMVNFVRDKDNARDFQPDIDIEISDVSSMSKMVLKLEIRHKSNWANEAVRAARRNKFMCALVQALRKIPIFAPGGEAPGLGDPANPSYSVAISDEEAKRNKESFAEQQDKARLVPRLSGNKTEASLSKTETASATDYLGTSTGMEGRENAAVDNLVKRNVSVDPEETVDRERGLALDPQRSSDVAEVRDILRRESTKGRRRAARHSGLSMQASADTYAGSRTIPTFPAPSPQVPVEPSQADRVSYFEDTEGANFDTSLTQPGWSTIAPLNYGQPLANTLSPQSARAVPLPASPAQDQSTSSPSRYVPGNAFSQQAHNAQTVHRVPVPGIPEMKKTLQQSPSSPPR